MIQNAASTADSPMVYAHVQTLLWLVGRLLGLLHRLPVSKTVPQALLARSRRPFSFLLSFLSVVS